MNEITEGTPHVHNESPLIQDIKHSRRLINTESQISLTGSQATFSSAARIDARSYNPSFRKSGKPHGESVLSGSSPSEGRSRAASKVARSTTPSLGK